MASSSTVSAGDTITATQYNNVRTDALSKEDFVPVTYTSGTEAALGSFATARINSGEDAYINFYAPALFSSLTEAVVVVVPAANANTSWDIDLGTHYGAALEVYTTHTAEDSTTTYDYSTSDNKLTEIDISSLLGSLAADDYVGVTIENNEADELYVLGVRFKWSG